MKRAYSFVDDEEDKERKKKLKGVDQAALPITLGMEDEIEPIFGLCSSCNYFHGAQTKFGRLYAGCDEMRIRLNSADPIIKCSYYEKRGMLELADLKEMAIIIDLNKNSIGF